MVEFNTITGPDFWASYFVNGDASGLNAQEKAQADAWLKREGVAHVVDVARDDDGEGREPRFTWCYDLYAPELDCCGGSVIDYIVEFRD